MNKVFSRRNLIVGAGAVAVTAATTYFVSKGTQTPFTKMVAPERLESQNGELTITLKVTKITKKLADRTVTMLAYNGSVPGPTLVVAPGDKVKVKLVNELEVGTNLHTHGLFVSPEGNSDNPFLHVMPGETFDYEFAIPVDHDEGTHWYHPHLHGQVANQVFGGLYGAIEVRDQTTPQVSEDRVLVISDASFNADGEITSPNMMGLMMGREGDYILVNGEVLPTGSTKKNAVERWRLVNACVARYLDLQVVGGSTTILGFDGKKFEKVLENKSFILAPGNRADVLVKTEKDQVSLNYTTVAHADSMMMGGNSQTFKNYPLVTLNATETLETTQIPMTTFPANDDLRQIAVNGKRNFILAMPNHGMGMGAGNLEGQFTINGAAFEMDKVNTTVANDTVEEWTIINTSTMQHPFHLHIWPMQLITVSGQAVNDVQYQDVVTVPANDQVTVRVHFRTYTGKTLYHCHILDHEDLGMMGVLESV